MHLHGEMEMQNRAVNPQAPQEVFVVFGLKADASPPSYVLNIPNSIHKAITYSLLLQWWGRLTAAHRFSVVSVRGGSILI